MANIAMITGSVDMNTAEQFHRCFSAEEAAYAALCADNHLGYSMPIGAVIAYPNHFSPMGVGYDIGCGNMAVQTNILYGDIEPHLPKIMDRIYSQISFGVGRKNAEPVDHPVLHEIADANVPYQRPLAKLAADQLGTVGSGNHYVDLFYEEHDGYANPDTQYVWIGLHFGSRGFGHKTTNGFYALAKGHPFGTSKIMEGSGDDPPVLLAADSMLGEYYYEAMKLAGAYAFAGRETVMTKVLSILGATPTYVVHCHHNFTWEEEHFGQKLYVVRKGSTPLYLDKDVFVGGSMGGPSYVLRGKESNQYHELLRSTVHGAGRAMSRVKAGGKWKRRREGNKKVWVQYKPGLVDWDQVQSKLRLDGIHLRGAGADEAPEAYKDIDEVLRYHKPSVEIRYKLRPIGVAMASRDEFDPYKD